MIGKTRLSIWMASLVLASGTVALAQGGGQDAEPLKFTVTLMGDYTDNRDANAAEESTFDFYFQPRLDAVAKWADDSSAVFYYAPTYRYQTDPSLYQNDSQLFHGLGLNLQQGLANIIKLRLNEAFNYTDDPSVQKYGETLRSDASFILNNLEAGATYLFTPLHTLDLYGRNMVKRYSKDEIAKDSDEDSTGGGVTLWGQVGKKVGLLAQAEVTEYSYESSLGLERGYSSFSGGVGLHGEFSPNFKADLRAGLQTVEYDDPTLSSEDSPYGSVSIMALPIPATRFTAGVSYMLRNSDVFPFASQTSTDFNGGLEWDAVPSRLTLALAGTYRQGEYSAESLPGSATAYPTGNRDAVIGSAAATFSIDEVTSLKLTQSYEDVSSDVSESFTKNTTTLAVSRVF